ncbi:zinc finger protein 91-like [Lethenteron reissneri]|uniref:zinc finger protein 91-like n=1 Tax=Lethenteron reissneri TaxID=7753 RepID=UPI002AB64F2F|nr:zinc finger protein 91-like [Lethenteron reissneri]
MTRACGCHRCEQPSDEGGSGRESRRGQEEQGARYTCDRCGAECVNGRGLSIHYSKHLREEAWSYRSAHSLPSPLLNLRPVGDLDLWIGRHGCEECGKSCSNKAGLQSHRKTHARKAAESGGGADCGRTVGRRRASENARKCRSPARVLGRMRNASSKAGATGPTADARRTRVATEARENPRGVRRDCDESGKESEPSRAPSNVRRFRCEECGRGFNGRHGLQVHRYKHARDAQSQLGEEPVSGRAQTPPKAELRENHRGSQCRCDECGKEFDSSRALNVHRFKHTRDSERRLAPEPSASHQGVPQAREGSQYECDECGKDFDTIHGLHVHLSKHSREAQSQLPQDTAGAVAMGSGLPNVQANPAKGQYGCGECGHEFDTEKGRQVHRHKHFTGAEGRPVEEPTAKCLKGTPQPELQSGHRGGGGQHACEECGKGFGSSHAKNIHRFKHKREAQSQNVEKPPSNRLDTSPQPEPRESVGKTLHTCEECGKGFGSSHAKNIHRFKHKREAQSQNAEQAQSSHLDASRREPRGNVERIQYRCEECGRGFDGRHGLQVHRYKHAREAQGQLSEEPVSGCAQTPPKAELLENHRGSQCRCDVCGKEFESSRALNVHRFKHTRDSERRLVQEPTVGCPKSSPRESQQELPETSLHRCEECGKGFATSHAKNIHRFKHKREAQSQLAEQPPANHRDVPRLQPREGDLDEKTLHECEECGKGFATSRARNIHRFMHTRDSQKQLVQEPTADYRNVPQPESQERPETGQFRCEECGKGFATSHAKNVHRFKHRREAESQLAERLSSNHSEISQPKALENLQEESRHRCDECGKEFDGVRDLQAEYQPPQNPAFVTIDGAPSKAAKSSLHGQQEGLHRCEECGKGFATSHAKNIHRFKHKREAQSQLAEQPPANHRDVPRLQPREGDLDEKTLHECEECGKGFATSRAMNIHRFMHTRDSQKQLVQEPTSNFQNVPQHESQERPGDGPVQV